MDYHSFGFALTCKVDHKVEFNCARGPGCPKPGAPDGYRARNRRQAGHQRQESAILRQNGANWV